MGLIKLSSEGIPVKTLDLDTPSVKKRGINMKEAFHELLLSLMVGIAGYGANQLQNATISINDLNKSMVSVVEKLTYQSESLKDHESRLRLMEYHKR